MEIARTATAYNCRLLFLSEKRWNTYYSTVYSPVRRNSLRLVLMNLLNKSPFVVDSDGVRAFIIPKTMHRVIVFIRIN